MHQSTPHLIASPCRRPASGPTTSCLGCPAGFSCRSRKGGPARSGGPPFLESPGLKRNVGRRRGGGPSASKTNTPRPTATDQHQEADRRRGRGASLRARGPNSPSTTSSEPEHPRWSPPLLGLVLGASADTAARHGRAWLGAIAATPCIRAAPGLFEP